jgi:hypothetical protein
LCGMIIHGGCRVISPVSNPPAALNDGHGTSSVATFIGKGVIWLTRRWPIFSSRKRRSITSRYAEPIGENLGWRNNPARAGRKSLELPMRAFPRSPAFVPTLTQRRHTHSVVEVGQCRDTWREQAQSYNCYLIHCRAAIQEAVKRVSRLGSTPDAAKHGCTNR